VIEALVFRGAVEGFVAIGAGLISITEGIKALEVGTRGINVDGGWVGVVAHAPCVLALYACARVQIASVKEQIMCEEGADPDIECC